MQVSVPRKEIDELVQNYNCTQEEAAKAYLTAQDRSKEAFSETLEEILGPRQKTTERDLKCYTPKEIKQHLGLYKSGQPYYER